MQLITLTDVTKSFKGRNIYEAASATFDAGAITAVVGPNGSGKSILFKLICGFIKPDSGQVWVDPKYLSPKRDFPQGFGVVIDRPGYIAHLSGIENLQQLANIRKQISTEQIAAMMMEFGLDPATRQAVKHYSLGMKQKLALIQAFMEDPKVVILDEPFNALDADSVAMVRTKIQDFQKAGGTVIFSSHNNADIELLANKVIEVNNGKLITRG